MSEEQSLYMPELVARERQARADDLLRLVNRLTGLVCGWEQKQAHAAFGGTVWRLYPVAPCETSGLFQWRLTQDECVVALLLEWAKEKAGP